MTERQATLWSALVTKSLKSRFSTDHFSALAAALSKKHARVPGGVLLQTVLELQSQSRSGVDPLVPQYVEHFLDEKWIAESDLLRSLSRSFSHRTQNLATNNQQAEQYVVSSSFSVSPQLEDVLFSLAATRLISEQKPTTMKEARGIMGALSAWIHVVATMNPGILLNLRSFPHESLSLYANLAALTISMLGNNKVRASLESMSDLAKTLNEALPLFIPILAQVSAPLAHRLQFEAQVLATSTVSSSAVSKLGMPNLGMSSTIDTQASQDRVGLLIYLEAVLYNWPMLDDNSLLTFVHFRNKGDNEASITELLTTAFELNSIAMNRGDAPNDLSIFRMFLSEKLPVLIQSLSSMAFMPVEISLILPQSLQRLSSDAIREEFLLACVLHGLILEDQVETLLGFRPSTSLPKTSKTSKETLIQEYRRDASQGERFVERLGARDGNSGAYAEAVVEIMHHLSLTRDTMALRGVCNALARRPAAMTALSLFASPTRFLNPLCQVIDSWRHDEDHSEYQPVYDEFGACFLLLMICMARFQLSRADLGPITQDGFVARVVDDTLAIALFPKELSEDDNKHLMTWTQGLFDTEGISDEVMSACPPQDFYRLVPTIFSQCIIAARSNLLPMEKLRNGLELLLEPFLFPSVILGIRSLIHHIWEHQEDAIIVLEMLQKLLMPANMTSSPTTVLAIVAEPLERALIDMRHRQPSSAETIDKLLEKLQPSLHRFRVSRPQALGVSEVPGGHETAASVTLSTTQHDFQHLCSWSIAGGASNDFTYSCSRMTSAAQSKGAPHVLRALIDEIHNSMQSPLLGETALDIASSIICTPYHLAGSVAIPNSPLGTSRLTLQTALHLELQDVAKISLRDPLRAQIITRLSRKVEMQLASMPSVDINLQNPTMPMMLDGTMDIEPVVTEQIVLQSDVAMEQVPDTSLTFGEDDNDFNLDIDAALASQNPDPSGFSAIPQSADDDIFAGLAFDADMDFS